MRCEMALKKILTQYSNSTLIKIGFAMKDQSHLIESIEIGLKNDISTCPNGPSKHN